MARLYKHATDPEPLNGVTPIDHGFELIDGRIHVRWFEGEQVPSVVDEEEGDEGEEVDDDEGDTEYEDNDSEVGEDDEDDGDSDED